MQVKKEKEIQKNMVVLTASQLNTTEQTKGFKGKMDIIHDKMKSANSWILLASSLTSLGTEIYETGKEVAEFSKQMPALTKKSLFSPVMYTDAILRIKKLTQKAITQLAQLEVSNMNILRADMKQKMMMLYYVRNYLAEIRSIMYNTRFYCKWLTGKGYSLMNIEDFLNSVLADEVMKKVIKIWQNHS